MYVLNHSKLNSIFADIHENIIRFVIHIDDAQTKALTWRDRAKTKRFLDLHPLPGFMYLYE